MNQFPSPAATRPRAATAVLIAVGVAQGLAALLIACLPDSLSHSEVWTGIVFGMAFGVVGLLAAWAALGPLVGIIRWPGSLAGTVLMTLALAFFFGRDAGSAALHILLIVAVGMFVLYWLAQLPLWWLRIRGGMQLRLPDGPVLAAGMGETQFSVRQLLIVTTLVACLLGMARWLLLADLQWHDSTFDWRVYLLFAILATFSTALVWLALGVTVGQLRPWLGGPLVLMLLVPLSFLEATTIIPLSRTSKDEDFLIIFLLNYVQFTWLFGCLLALRWAGYRMGREN